MAGQARPKVTIMCAGGKLSLKDSKKCVLAGWAFQNDSYLCALAGDSCVLEGISCA